MENPNELPAPQQTPELPAPKKWGKNKGILAVIFLAIIAAVAIWAYFILNQPQNLGPIVIYTKPEVKQATSTPVAITANSIPSSPASSTPVQQPEAVTSGWKLYTNSQYQNGYQMQLPQVYHAQTNNEPFRMETDVVDTRQPDSQNLVFSVAVSFWEPSYESRQEQVLEFAQSEIGKQAAASGKIFQQGLLVKTTNPTLYYFFILSGNGLGADFLSPTDYFSTKEFLNILLSFKFTN